MLAKDIANKFEYATSIGGGYLFSETFLGKCREMFQEAAQNAGIEALQKQKEMMMAGSVVGGDAKNFGEDGGSGKGGKKGRKKKGKDNTFESNEEPEVGRGKKKKGKRGKRGKRGAAESDDEDYAGSASSSLKGSNKAKLAKPPRMSTAAVSKLLNAHDETIEEDALFPLASYFREFAQSAFQKAHVCPPIVFGRC